VLEGQPTYHEGYKNVNIVFIDFETFYSKDYSLRKMTPVQYVLDPRFESIGCSFKEGRDGKSYWVDGPDLPAAFAKFDPAVTCMGSHNWLFDGCIVAWRYGFNPALMFDTLGMARSCLRYKLRSVSLKSVMKYLDIGVKGDTVQRVEGMSLEAIKQAGLFEAYKSYSMNDCDGCAGIFEKLVVNGAFPMSELRIMDMILRCTIEPRFVLDPNVLAEHLAQVQADKAHLLAQAMLMGCDGKSDLMSDEKLAGMLRQLGVDPPTKISPTTGKEKYAFAKTDTAFLDLADSDNPSVQVLVEARLGHKSTLEETRTQRFIDISTLQWPVTQVGNMPMPIAYGAAHTHRLGGDWSLNVQNLSRPNPVRPNSGKLRRALTAPPGHAVMTVDAAQIEAREVVTFSGQWDVVEQFDRGEDTYANIASEIFGFKVNKKDHPNERFVGKQARLGLGYQLWWPKFKARVKTDSINQTGNAIELTDDQALTAVKTFRRLNSHVEAAWASLNTEGIDVLVNGGQFEFASCIFRKGSVQLPNGLLIRYDDMQQAYDQKKGRMQWTFSYGVMRHGIYGGKLMENLMQALARIHTLDAAIRIQDRSKKEFGTPYRLAQQAHDENVFIVRNDHVPAMKAIMLEEMCRRPWWAPKLPLAAEVGFGPSYGDAK
jgi:hypothetical protein